MHLGQEERSEAGSRTLAQPIDSHRTWALSDFSVLISSTRNQPTGPQSCEEAQMGQKAKHRAQSLTQARPVSIISGRSSNGGWLQCLVIFTGSKGAGGPGRPAKPQEMGPPQHEAAYGPASPRGRARHWVQTLPIIKLKLSQASPSVGEELQTCGGLWGTPEQLRGSSRCQ